MLIQQRFYIFIDLLIYKRNLYVEIFEVLHMHHI